MPNTSIEATSLGGLSQQFFMQIMPSYSGSVMQY